MFSKSMLADQTLRYIEQLHEPALRWVVTQW
jgi:hypothetical protein